MNRKDPDYPVTEDLLHAFVDGQLPADQAELVAAHLAANPEKSAMVDDWKRQNAAMAELFPASEAATRAGNMPRISVSRAANLTRPIIQIAAALALVGFGIAGGWFARGGYQATTTQMQVSLVQDAVVAHALFSAEVLHPVEVSASQEDHLVGWLSKRLGSKISAPDISASGYQLVGGRLLPSGSGPAAQFMYEDGKGQRITIYAVASSPGVLASFQFKSRDGLSSIYWQDEFLRYAVVGTVDRDELTRLATEVYRQLI